LNSCLDIQLDLAFETALARRADEHAFGRTLKRN
jgi:hypothetical protein